jgi:hypothetical protein
VQGELDFTLRMKHGRNSARYGEADGVDRKRQLWCVEKVKHFGAIFLRPPVLA